MHFCSLKDILFKILRYSHKDIYKRQYKKIPHTFIHFLPKVIYILQNFSVILQLNDIDITQQPYSDFASFICSCVYVCLCVYIYIYICNFMCRFICTYHNKMQNNNSITGISCAILVQPQTSCSPPVPGNYYLVLHFYNFICLIIYINGFTQFTDFETGFFHLQ